MKSYRRIYGIESVSVNSCNTTVFETSATGSEGTSPLSHVYKTPIPKDIRRDTPVVFKLRFLDENKSPKHYDANR